MSEEKMMEVRKISEEMGRQVAKSLGDAADAMRKFADVWNDGRPAPGYPLMAGVLKRRGDTP